MLDQENQSSLVRAEAELELQLRQAVQCMQEVQDSVDAAKLFS